MALDPFAIPLIVISSFWFLVGGVAPFFVQFAFKPENQALVRVMLSLTAVCCYMFWLCTYLHQYKPIIGPQLSNETAKALQLLWGNQF